jgi:serine/threonine protein kinase
MSDLDPPVPDSEPWTRVNLISDRFEAAWREGQRPRLEDYLGGSPRSERPALLRVLLELEFELRRQAGEHPTPEEYRPRFPGDTALIDEVFNPKATGGAGAARSSTLSLDHAPPPIREVAALPERFGRYQILRRLGGGGMGAVYLAHDRTLDRRVALKVPLFTAADGPGVFERFLREARAAAMIHHPNLCPIHDVGQIEGIHYLTMAHIEGRPLSEVVRTGRVPEPRKVAALVRSLALALAEAHRAGVIHRDLKPSNIMITKRGVPVIIDFGLARRFGKGDPRLTDSGMMLGTPAYMPPEQVDGRVADMGPCCDVYSLGVILYELLAGRPPYLGTLLQIIAQVSQGSPRPPSAHRPGLDPRLEAICLKAMARESTERYATMDELAAVLDGYLRSRGPSDPPKPGGPSASTTPTADDAPATVAAPRRRRLVPLGAVVVTGVVALVLAGPHVLPLLPVIDPRPGTTNEPAVPQKPMPISPPRSIPENPPATSEPPTVEREPPAGQNEGDSEIARLTERIRLLTERIRLDPGDIQAINDRGGAYLKRGKAASDEGKDDLAAADYDRALADYTEVIRLATGPQAAVAYRNRGSTYYQKGEFARAIAEYTKAIRIKEDADFYTHRGQAYIESGEIDLAISDLDEAISLDANNDKAYTERARAYWKKGDLTHASADRETAEHLKAMQK